MRDECAFDEDYFENGIPTGKSLYTNYRWLPEATMSMVMAIIDKLCITPEHKILDFGCAKGYAVKAFHLLRRQAWGCDISPYAIESGDESIKDYIRLIKDDPIPFKFHFDFAVAKDVRSEER